MVEYDNKDHLYIKMEQSQFMPQKFDTLTLKSSRGGRRPMKKTPKLILFFTLGIITGLILSYLFR